MSERLAENEVDAALLSRNSSLAYLVGEATPWRSGAVVTRDGEFHVLTSEYDAARLEDQSWVSEVQTWTKGKDAVSFAAAAASILEDLDVAVDRLGVELGSAQVPGVLSATEYETVTDAFADVEVTNVVDVVNEEMLIKTAPEIERLRRAAAIADIGQEAADEALSVGVSELEIAGAAERAMREAGDEFTWATTGNEVGSGYRQCYPDGLTVMTSDKRVQRGDAITVDLHPRYDGYLGDLCLTRILGDPTPEQRSLINAWEHVTETLLDGLQPGNNVKDVAEATIEMADDTGYREHFFDSYMGHGLGTSARIAPLISTETDLELEENMVVVPLAFIGKPGVGAMRLECPVLITASGHEILTKTPYDSIARAV